METNIESMETNFQDVNFADTFALQASTSVVNINMENIDSSCNLNEIIQRANAADVINYFEKRILPALQETIKEQIAAAFQPLTLKVDKANETISSVKRTNNQISNAVNRLKKSTNGKYIEK